jgi:hypothetical protein
MTTELWKGRSFGQPSLNDERIDVREYSYNGVSRLDWGFGNPNVTGLTRLVWGFCNSNITGSLYSLLMVGSCRSFGSLMELNTHLRTWEASVADKRIHSTTRQQVGHVFEHIERPPLQALPVDLFPSFQEGNRRVNRDCIVEVAKAYYQAPVEHIGRDVWVRWDRRSVQFV